jgi:uncharacterized membrane protein YccC
MPDLAEQRPPDSSEGEADNDSRLLDRHRDFLLAIDDASRRGYSLLGIGALVAGVVLVLATGTALFSMAGIALFLAGGLAAMIAGRFLFLSRQDVRLRSEVRRYCQDRGIEVADLLDQSARAQRFEFVVKLFAGRGGQPSI